MTRPSRLLALAPLLSAAYMTLGGLGGAPLAHAAPKLFLYDQFDPDLSVAASTINGMTMATQPGWVQGEAFGQLYRPEPGDYPLTITGVDLILAAPPGGDGAGVNATIEVYNTQSDTADPGAGPLFTVSTSAIFNPLTNDLGLPLQGGYGYQLEFDYTDPQNHPPVITSGDIWIMIRLDDQPASGFVEWGTLDCIVVPNLTCGCQGIGSLHDALTTPRVNIMRHVTPLGACSGSTAWSFMEDAGINGDLIMRMHAEVSGSACVPSCETIECGDDGCGGSCGTCADGIQCKLGLCEAACVADCDGKVCGGDGCGGSCGGCDSDALCQAGQCNPWCTPACGSRVCGTDGCSGSCGLCDGAQHCDDTTGACVADCIPACEGAACGGDGCGGSCGACGQDQRCVAGTCEAPPADLAIATVSPDFAINDADTPVAITGAGFIAGMTFKIGATDLQDVSLVGAGLASGTLPAGLEPGIYTVIAATADDVATLADAFEIRAPAQPPAPQDPAPDPAPDPATDPATDLATEDPARNFTAGQDQGCAGGGLSAPLFLLLALPWATRRRRRRSHPSQRRL